MSYVVLNREDLLRDGSNYEFEGYLHGDSAVSFIWVAVQPGEGPRLHRHAYDEIIIVQEGQVTFRVDDQTIEGHAGQVVIIAAGTAHAFRNSGAGTLRQIDLHLSNTILTEWLED